jgi:threonine dehydratase
MVRGGRLARIRVQVRDLPGSLARVTALLAELSANIEAVHHQRAFTLLGAQDAEVDLVLKTRSHAHVAEIVAALTRDGYLARVRNFDE